MRTCCTLLTSFLLSGPRVTNPHQTEMISVGQLINLLNVATPRPWMKLSDDLVFNIFAQIKRLNVTTTTWVIYHLHYQNTVHLCRFLLDNTQGNLLTLCSVAYANYSSASVRYYWNLPDKLWPLKSLLAVSHHLVVQIGFQLRDGKQFSGHYRHTDAHPFLHYTHGQKVQVQPTVLVSEA